MTDRLPARERRVIIPSLEAVRGCASGLQTEDVVDGSADRQADLTVALDVLEHLASATEYRQMVELLWQSTSQTLVVSGFADAFEGLHAGEYYHEPLRHTLSAVASDAELFPITVDGSSEAVAVLRTPDHPHPRDFGSKTLETLIDRIPDPAALLAMRLEARTTVGFYPDHSPRLWEYPVVAGLLMEHLEPGSRAGGCRCWGISPGSRF